MNRIDAGMMKILPDTKTLANIRKSLADIKAGRYKDYFDVSEFRKEFESKSLSYFSESFKANESERENPMSIGLSDVY